MIAKGIVLHGPNDFKLEEFTIPSLKKGQVLVEMAFTPFNPSDLAFLTGNYGLKKPYPVVPGLEGSGKVISSGGGFLANMLLNKRVACTAPTNGNGTWASHMIADATGCIKLSDQVSLEQGSMFFVNPLTALSFAKQAAAMKADLVVLSAAGSALAKMINYFLKPFNIKSIGVVRSEKNIAGALANGFHTVLNSSDNTYLSNLKTSGKTAKKAIFFDAVGGGEVPYQILGALPSRSTMVVYGRLDLNTPAFAPQDLIFTESNIKGYWLAKEASKKSLFEILMDTKKVQNMLKNGFETKIQKIVKLDQVEEGLKTYISNMSEGKVLIDLKADL